MIGATLILGVAADYPVEWTKVFLFKWLVSSVREADVCLPEYCEYEPAPVNPKHPLSMTARVWLDWAQQYAIFGFSGLPNLGGFVDRIEVAVLWSTIHAQKALPTGERTFTDQDLDTLTGLFCQYIGRLKPEQLPPMYRDLPSLSCDQIRAGL